MKDAPDQQDELLLALPKWKIWYVMIVIFILLFFDFASRVVISPLFPLIKEEFSLSDSQLGLLNTVVLITIAVLAMPLSYLIDRWRRGKMMSLMAILWSAASIVSGIAGNFAVLLTGRAFLGVAEASYNSAGQAMIMATIKKHLRTTVTGLLYTGMTLGMAGGMALGGLLGATYGWRLSLILMAIPGIIFGILAWFIPDYKNQPRNITTQGHSTANNFKSTMIMIFKNKTVMVLVVSYAMVNFLIYTIVSWLPTYLIRFGGMNIATAGSVTGIVLLTGLIAMPAGGWLGDIAARRSAKTKILIIIVAVILAVVANSIAVLFTFWPLFIVVSLAVNLLVPAQQVCLQEVVPLNQRATVFGFYYAGIFILGGLWAPLVIGAISDAMNLKIAFAVSIGIAAVATILYPLAYKFFDNDFNQARRVEQDIASQAVRPNN